MVGSHQSQAFEKKGRSLFALVAAKEFDYPHCTLRDFLVRWEDGKAGGRELLVETFGECSVGTEAPPPDLRYPFQSPSEDMFQGRIGFIPLLIVRFRFHEPHCLDFIQRGAE